MAFILFLLSFIKIGAFTYGGGLAMIPLLRDIAVNSGWMSDGGFADLIAISQSTPGPIAINMATFIGYGQYGPLGSVLASLSVVLPGFVFALVISKFLTHFNEQPVVKHALIGLKASIIGLLFTAIIQVGRVSLLSSNSVDIKAVVLLIGSFIAIRLTKWHPIVYIVIVGIMSLFIW